MYTKELPLHERNICIFADENKKREFNDPDWIEVGKDLFVPSFILYRLWKNRYNLKEIYKKKLPYPIFDLDEARSSFNFPPSHPQNGFVYATSEFDEYLYVPLSSFHRYMYESKMAAFVELCSSLGAKSCKVVYAEENGQVITSNLVLNNIPTNAGVLNTEANFSKSSKKNQNVDVYFSFPPYKKITKYETKWMNGEPTWETLQKVRLQNSVENYSAEFNYADDFGVTADVANSLNGVGVKIGGSFSEFKKIKYLFDVEFWPKD